MRRLSWACLADNKETRRIKESPPKPRNTFQRELRRCLMQGWRGPATLASQPGQDPEKSAAGRAYAMAFTVWSNETNDWSMLYKWSLVTVLVQVLVLRCTPIWVICAAIKLLIDSESSVNVWNPAIPVLIDEEPLNRFSNSRKKKLLKIKRSASMRLYRKDTIFRLCRTLSCQPEVLLSSKLAGPFFK